MSGHLQGATRVTGLRNSHLHLLAPTRDKHQRVVLCPQCCAVLLCCVISLLFLCSHMSFPVVCGLVVNFRICCSMKMMIERENNLFLIQCGLFENFNIYNINEVIIESLNFCLPFKFVFILIHLFGKS